jgi:hypothetical protein
MPGLSGTDNSSNSNPLRTLNSSLLIHISSSNNSIPTRRNNNSSSSLPIRNLASLAHTTLLLTRPILRCPRYLLTLSPWSLLLTYPVPIPSVLVWVSLLCTHRRLHHLLQPPLAVLIISNNTTMPTRNMLLPHNIPLIPWTRVDGSNTISLMPTSTTHTTNNPSLCNSSDLSRAETISPTHLRLLQTPGSR